MKPTTSLILLLCLFCGSLAQAAELDKEPEPIYEPFGIVLGSVLKSEQDPSVTKFQEALKTAGFKPNGNERKFFPVHFDILVNNMVSNATVGAEIPADPSIFSGAYKFIKQGNDVFTNYVNVNYSVETGKIYCYNIDYWSTNLASQNKSIEKILKSGFDPLVKVELSLVEKTTVRKILDDYEKGSPFPNCEMVSLTEVAKRKFVIENGSNPTNWEPKPNLRFILTVESINEDAFTLGRPKKIIDDKIAEIRKEKQRLKAIEEAKNAKQPGL